MSARETCLRMALGMYAADPQSPIAAPLRSWIIRRLQDERPFTPTALDALLPGLLKWADARNAALGQTLREVLGLATPVPLESRPRNLAWEAGEVRSKTCLTHT